MIPEVMTNGSRLEGYFDMVQLARSFFIKGCAELKYITICGFIISTNLTVVLYGQILMQVNKKKVRRMELCACKHCLMRKGKKDS